MTTESNEAPGRLDLVRDFVNTLDLPDGPDRLEGLEQAAAWCRERGLPLPSNQEETDWLRQFREALRALIYANNGEGELGPAWERFSQFLRDVRLSIAVDAAGQPSLVAACGGVDATVAALATIVYDAVSDKTWPRLRACRKSTCRFAYYDRSKNGSRAWCSMAVCGNREKAQRRRKRERQEHVHG